MLQAIVTHAAGNPFFLEELTWMAMERHTSALQRLGIPDTIQAVLAARIDRLPPDEKRLLQTAAVMGTDIAVPLLQAVTEMPLEVVPRALAHLQALELLYEQQRFPEAIYLFKHVLTQDVAYHSLLAQRRKDTPPGDRRGDGTAVWRSAGGA